MSGKSSISSRVTPGTSVPVNQREKKNIKLTGDSQNARTSPSNQYSCECGRNFAVQSSLVLHQKECGRRDKTKCQHCGQQFATYPGVRQHERRKHPELYEKELADKLPDSEATLLSKLADIEARSIRRDFFSEMMAATGLTKHQIRHRREKEIYKKYLERAKKNRIEESKSIFKPTSPTTSRATEAPKTPRALRALRRAAPVEPEIPPTDTGSFDDILSPPPHPQQEHQLGYDTVSSETPQLPYIAEETSPTTSRPTLDLSDITSTGTAAPLMPSQRQRLSRRLSASLNHLDNSGPVSEESTPSWISDLLGFIKGDNNEQHLTQIINNVTAEDAQGRQKHIDTWLQQLYPKGKTCKQRRNKPAKNVSRTPAYGQTNTGSGRRAARYKKAQDLYSKSRKTLACNILSGTNFETGQVYPTLGAVENFYGQILESESPPDNELLNVCDGDAPDIWHPVSREEVETAKKNWHPSAPGPDGITIEDVKRTPNSDLCVLFTLILHTNTQPSSWRRSRTILIPKDGNLEDPANWRPITISSSVQRLLHRILTRRIRNHVKLHASQRGFTAIDGTLANSMVLDHYVRDRTERCRSYCVVSLDIRKAFDTVSHNSLRRAMCQKQFPEDMIDYILDSLDSVTSIQVGAEKTRDIQVRRGVKQGDPLSPTLFNLVMDELLADLNNGDTGAKIGENHCAAMAYADDVVLLEDDETLMPETLDQVSNFCRLRGMSLNPSKSKCLAVTVLNKKSIPRNKPMYKIDGKWIPMVPMSDTFRFLGHEFNSTGIMKPTLPNLPIWVRNVCSSPLKPDQRLTLVRDYLIPRLIYGLQNPRITAKALKDVDKLVKGCVKRILHLHLHTADAAIHASLRDGGLGIMELRAAIPRIFLSRLSNLLENSEDAILSFVLQSERTRHLMEKLSHLAGDVPETQKWRQILASSPITGGMEVTVEDAASRTWISDKPSGWTGRDYVRAVHLRTGNLPTKAIPSNPADQRRCRAGCDTSESLQHVLQKCPTTHGFRISRHNEIVKKIASHCRKRWQVEEEPHIRHQDGQLFKPDIAVHLPNNEIVVLDVQVSWEGRRPMPVIWDAKRIVYDNPKFREAAENRWRGKKLIFTPIIIGARGIWPRVNEPAAELLQFPPPLKRSCVQSALKWGSSIHGFFMRSVWE